MRPANSPPAHDLGASPTRRGPRWIGRFTKPQLVQLVSFGLNGVSTAIVYSAAVWSLIAVSPRTFAFDVLLAYAIATAAHYFGSRLVFRAKTGMHGHDLLRYLAVVAASWLTTASLAWCLHRTAVNNVIAVYLPVAVTPIPTFLLMRNWVFKNPKAVQPRTRRDS